MFRKAGDVEEVKFGYTLLPETKEGNTHTPGKPAGEKKIDLMGCMRFFWDPWIATFSVAAIVVSCFLVDAIFHEQDKTHYLVYIAGIASIAVFFFALGIMYKQGSLVMRMKKELGRMKTENDKFRKSNDKYKALNEQLHCSCKKFENDCKKFESGCKKFESDCKKFKRQLKTFEKLESQLDEWAAATGETFENIVGRFVELQEDLDKSTERLEQTIEKNRMEQRKMYELKTFNHYQTIAWTAQYKGDGDDDFTKREWQFLTQKISPVHLPIFCEVLPKFIKPSFVDEFRSQFIGTEVNAFKLGKIFEWLKDTTMKNEVGVLDAEVLFDGIIRNMTTKLGDKFVQDATNTSSGGVKRVSNEQSQTDHVELKE